MVEVKVVGAEKVASYLRKKSHEVKNSCRDTMNRVTVILQAGVVGKLNGAVLNVRTGTLRRSINRKVISTNAEVRGSVGTNVKYGAVHEYGGTFQIPGHTATRRKYAIDQSGRRLVATRRQSAPELKSGFRKVQYEVHKASWTVRAHPATYPERSFLRSTLKEQTAQILHAFATVIRLVVKGSK